MEIFVAIKQVPDTDKVKMDPETGTMVREGVEAIINPLDLYAIELAIQLKEKHGGTVTVFTMGPPSAEKALREAMAMGCDRGVLITDRAFSGSDTWATSYTLSAAVKKIGPFDIILAGERATDGDTGQVGPCLAAWLNIPIISYVGMMELEAEENNLLQERKIKVRRLVEGGYQVLEVELPCLLTVLKEVATPRLPTLRGKKFARTTPLTIYGANDLDLDQNFLGLRGSPTKVTKIFYPKMTRSGTVVRARDENEIDTAIDALLSFLDSKNLIRG